LRPIIYRDLKKSPYKIIVNNIEFIFSSEFYKNKFKENVDNFIENFKLEFESRFQLKVDLKKYASIVYYTKVEKRGFLIVVDSEVVEWQKNIILDGQIKTMKI
jgi:YHS domain-containing protein